MMPHPQSLSCVVFVGTCSVFDQGCLQRIHKLARTRTESSKYSGGPSMLDFMHDNSLGAVQLQVESPLLKHITGFDVVRQLSQRGRP